MINHQLTLTYSDVYGRQPDRSTASLFEGVTSEYAYGLMEVFNSNEQNYNSTEKIISYLREKWFSRDNVPAYLFIEERILDIARRHRDTEITIFNAPSSLTFLEHLLHYLNQQPAEPGKRPDNAQMERKLLDAYLMINQEKNRADNGIETIRRDFPEEATTWLFLYKPFQYADLINRDLRELFFIEVAKAAVLFEFLFENKDTAKILQSFLQQYDCTWEIYMTAISGMTVITIDTPNHRGNNFVHIDPELPFYDTCIKILDAIEIPIDQVDLAEDYLFLRNHPIVRTAKDKFQVVYKRFFIEKIFRALYFELSKINTSLGVMSRDKFRTMIYTSGYSENKLLYEVLDKIFENAQKCIRGNVMEQTSPQFGASDYICDFFGNIFLFESKDILIRKEVKDRLYIPELREEFRKKFYKDGNSDKAVLQLAKNVKKLIDRQYEQFGFVYQKYRFIYPVIVVHSDAFTVLGINQLLKNWFEEACDEAGVSKKARYKIKPVVIIDINTLLYFQDRINKKGAGLNQLIDQYTEQTDLRKSRQKKSRSAVAYESEYLIPFAHYVEHTIKSMKSVMAPRSVVERIKSIILNKKHLL